jgi:hypothetical protein
VTAIHDIYRDGSEAGLRHVERAIEWYMAFDAQRRQANDDAGARNDPSDQDRDGVQLSFPTARAERLIEGLQAIAELLRGLQRAPTADPNRK